VGGEVVEHEVRGTAGGRRLRCSGRTRGTRRGSCASRVAVEAVAPMS
jgi:hypothetical protein